MRRKVGSRARGLRRDRFSVKSSSDCARSRTDGSRRMFLFFADAVLLCFAYVDTLSALELLRSKDVLYSSALPFYCVLQLSVCGSQWSGCVKVHRCDTCMRNTIVF